MTPAEEFGQRVRREREGRGIALAAIAEQTKVKAALFEAMERGDLSRWPSGIFRRSFARAYAQAVGLDVDHVVQQFLELFPPEPAEATPPPEAPGSAFSRSAQAGFNLLVKVGEHRFFAGGRDLLACRDRFAAAAWDAGIINALALVLYLALERFWTPLAVIAVCYYFTGILLLGNTPGVCLFAPDTRAPKTPDDAHPSASMRPPPPARRRLLPVTPRIGTGAE